MGKPGKALEPERQPCRFTPTVATNAATSSKNLCSPRRPRKTSYARSVRAHRSSVAWPRLPPLRALPVRRRVVPGAGLEELADESGRPHVKQSLLHSTPKAQTDLFAPRPVVLPSTDELARRFAEFNLRYFANTLPPVTIKWSKRMRIAGTCDSYRKIITLSHTYHTHFPDDVDDTLKHEMIHLRIPRHDAAFRREAACIGTSVHCRDYPELHPRARYVYICPACGMEYPRAKRAQLYCGRCARRGFDPRFKLILKSGAETERVVRSLAARSPQRKRTGGVRRRLRNLGEFMHRLL